MKYKILFLLLSGLFLVGCRDDGRPGGAYCKQTCDGNFCAKEGLECYKENSDCLEACSEDSACSHCSFEQGSIFGF